LNVLFIGISVHEEINASALAPYVQVQLSLPALFLAFSNLYIHTHTYIFITIMKSLNQKDALDGIEFARGSPKSKWGSVRAAMGHPEPFDLRYVAVGNEDCWHFNYQGMQCFYYSLSTHLQCKPLMKLRI